MKIHLLNQHSWPDCSPTAIVCELVAVYLRDRGLPIRLVAGTGWYRPGNRPDPKLDVVLLPTKPGRRGHMLSTLAEYHDVCRSFRRYIEKEVAPGDTVICTSAPPQTMDLVDSIHKKGARAIYWLQDYYPDLLRGFLNYPKFVRSLLRAHWNRWLRRWDVVVKCAANLHYDGPNVRILRNFPTLNVGEERPFEPKTARYFGNLGYGHSLAHFVRMCEELRAGGYQVSLVGDGPKVASLPSWIECRKPVDEPTLIDLLWRAEVHLIAADPNMTGAIFPSKYWNSRATGRKILSSGFAGSMLDELNIVNRLETLPSPAGWLELLSKS